MSSNVYLMQQFKNQFIKYCKTVQVVANCLSALQEIWGLEASTSEEAVREREALISKPIIYFLLNRYVVYHLFDDNLLVYGSLKLVFGNCRCYLSSRLDLKRLSQPYPCHYFLCLTTQTSHKNKSPLLIDLFVYGCNSNIPLRNLLIKTTSNLLCA